MSQTTLTAMPLGRMANFVYLIIDDATRRTAVVDPAWDAAAILAATRAAGATITDVLLTHSHHDHVNALAEVVSATDAQVHLLKDEAKFWGANLDRPTLHAGGDTLTLGRTPIEVLHTPGHTPGSACYRIGNDLLTGDTLFVFGCGRCDIKGGDAEQMYASLRRLAEHLPAQTVIHPGHDYSVQPTSTLAEEIAGNPFLQQPTLADFVRYRLYDHDRTRPMPMAPLRVGAAR